MTTLTIPKNLIKERDLVIIPRREYVRLVAKFIRVVDPTVSERRAIKIGRKEIDEGEFVTLVQLKNELASLRRKSGAKKS